MNYYPIQDDLSKPLRQKWNEFVVAFEDASVRLKSKHLSFAFVEGELVTAVREGKFEFFASKNKFV